MRKTPFKQKKCKQCGETFTPNKQLQAFCNHTCANKWSNNKRHEALLKTFTCRACGKEYRLRPSSMANKKFCSKKCHNSTVQTVSSMKKRAWSEFTKYIRNRDNWTCITCGKVGEGKEIHGGHFISRRYNSTLFDEHNVHAQCSGCNMFRNGEPHIYAERIIELYGIEELHRLIALSKIEKKWTVGELIKIRDYYKELNTR